MKDRRWSFWLGLIFVAGSYVALCRILGLDLLEHSPYDSYTLQAMMWRAGRISLDQDYPWLEIAHYGGQLYISFPPFPSVPMLLLSFIFDNQTPSRLVSMAMVLLSYALGYRIARRAGASRAQSAFSAAFLVLGCNLAEYGLYGGVWNVAQAMGFCLTLAAFDGVLSERRGSMALGLIAIACAVGCRPFQAAYVPVLMLVAYQTLRRDGSAKSALLQMIPMLVVPALIALGYGAYNYARFSNPLEFGHNYLPEFLEQSEYGQFSLRYVAGNLQNILRLPWFEGGLLSFPTAYGFAFWLVNPMFVLFTAVWIARLAARRMDAVGSLTLAALVIHFFATLMHKSLGGVQFGTRYLCDLIPAMYWLWALYAHAGLELHPRRQAALRSHRAVGMRFGGAGAGERYGLSAERDPRDAAVSGWVGYLAPLSPWPQWLSIAAMALGIALNLYGAWYFHVLVG